MPKDNRNFFEKKKDWSEIKDTLLGAYLKPYLQKILMTRHPVFYVDCFSGKGRFDDGKPGSPIIALDVRKECMASTKSEKASIDMCFIDLNYASELEMNLREYGDSCWKPIIISGKYEEKIIEILKNKRNYNVFLYIDPYGIQALDSGVFECSPHSDIRVMTPELLEKFKKNVRDFMVAVCQKNNFKNTEKINTLIRGYKLNKEVLVEEYTTSYYVKGR